MKNRSYANRGMGLESLLEFANDRYRQQGKGFIHKNATEFKPIRDRSGKVVSCKVEHKATIDFLGRYESYPIAIEAKHSCTGSMRFDRVEGNQADDMDDFCKAAGTIGLVVISFDMKRFFAIPWAFWSVAYETRVRKKDDKTPLIVEAYGIRWEIPKKFSFRASEIPPEFEIPDHDYTFGLDYLQRAERYAY